jgi:hypothetical protein
LVSVQLCRKSVPAACPSAKCQHFGKSPRPDQFTPRRKARQGVFLVFFAPSASLRGCNRGTAPSRKGGVTGSKKSQASAYGIAVSTASCPIARPRLQFTPRRKARQRVFLVFFGRLAPLREKCFLRAFGPLAHARGCNRHTARPVRAGSSQASPSSASARRSPRNANPQLLHPELQRRPLHAQSRGRAFGP